MLSSNKNYLGIVFMPQSLTLTLKDRKKILEMRGENMKVENQLHIEGFASNVFRNDDKNIWASNKSLIFHFR